MSDIMKLHRKELFRWLPFVALMLLAIWFYRDYEQIVSSIYILSVISAIALAAHYIRKALFPYANIEVAWKKSLETPQTSAAVYIAKLVFILGLIWLIASFIQPSRANAATMPSAKAQRYLPVLKESFDKHWPDAPMRHNAAGQIEQESAGWNERAELKTSREYGFGLGQITITDRFNNFKAAQKLFPGWKWEDRFNVRNQLTYAVISDRSNFKQVARLFRDDDSRWRGSLVAYNAGLGTVLQRRALAIRKGVTADKWIGGLDQVSMSYESKLLYGRPLYKMRNEYPRIICDIRAPKYKGWLE